MSENSINNHKPGRKMIRLKGYDYRQTGAYFVTICTKDKKPIFGRISRGEIILNHLGKIARRELIKINNSHPQAWIYEDEFVVMPNHIHVIVWIASVGATQRVARKSIAGPVSGLLGAIIGQYKSRVTKGINSYMNTSGILVWKRNYYDRIIRHHKELLRIKKYIADNPLRWEEDQLEGIHNFLK